MKNSALSSALACVLATVASASIAQALPKVPSASPGCDAKNICRVYVTVEKGASGKDEVYVYPDALHTNTGKRDAHVVWIALNDDVTFQSTASIAIQKGDPTQWTDKYTTDDDDGDRPGSTTFRPKNFHGRFPAGATPGTYKYAITVQRLGEAPVSKDPTIVNSR
ncbi:MAG: hypothetical protein ACREXI_05975 [Caldimonas sp.]